MSDGSSEKPPAKASLQEKLTEWFSTQGYPLEYEVADTAQRFGYSARLGERIEWSDRKPREIDVIASQRRNLQLGNVNAELTFSLLVECKYRGTSKPWIGMCQAETRRNVQLASVRSLHDGLCFFAPGRAWMD